MEIKSKNIWCFAAHADDETLGCGGTINKLWRENTIHSTAFTNGVGARYLSGSEPVHKPVILKEGEHEEAQERLKSWEKAQKILGIKGGPFQVGNYLDNMMDQYPTLRVAKDVESCLEHMDPDIVFTHFRDDLNVDHQKVSEATYVALRPQPGQKCKMILEYEISSSTEYSQYDFNPNVFVDITDQIETKIEAFQQYEKEGRAYPHPRSIQSIMNRAAYWGSCVGVNFAEAFVCRRMII